jgi:hypothetical protein
MLIRYSTDSFAENKWVKGRETYENIVGRMWKVDKRGERESETIHRLRRLHRFPEGGDMTGKQGDSPSERLRRSLRRGSPLPSTRRGTVPFSGSCPKPNLTTPGEVRSEIAEVGTQNRGPSRKPEAARSGFGTGPLDHWSTFC